MQKLFTSALIIVVGLSVGSRATTTGAQLKGGPGRETPVLLLPGYTDRGGRGIDSRVGRISRPNGPLIDYDIAPTIGTSAMPPQGSAKVPVLRLPATEPSQIVLAMDFEHNRMSVTVGIRARFFASNITSRSDVAEVMAMIYTYRPN